MHIDKPIQSTIWWWLFPTLLVVENVILIKSNEENGKQGREPTTFEQTAVVFVLISLWYKQNFHSFSFLFFVCFHQSRHSPPQPHQRLHLKCNACARRRSAVSPWGVLQCSPADCAAVQPSGSLDWRLGSCYALHICISLIVWCVIFKGVLEAFCHSSF